MGCKIRNQTEPIVEGDRHHDAEALTFERLVPAFDFAIGLRVVRRRFDMVHSGNPNELRELFGNELSPLSLMILGRA